LSLKSVCSEESLPDATDTVPRDIDMAVKVLHADGMRAKRMLVNVTADHHDEVAWATRFPAALAFLFPMQR
jgi:hypothetical protein